MSVESEEDEDEEEVADIFAIPKDESVPWKKHRTIMIERRPDESEAEGPKDDSDSDYEAEFGGDFKLLGNLIRHKNKVSTVPVPKIHVEKSSSESGSESDEEEKSNEERYFEDLVLEKISE